MLKTIITLRDCLPIESVSFNDVSTRVQISFMDCLNDLWLGQREKIIIVLQEFWNIFKSVAYLQISIRSDLLTSVVIFLELILLNLSSHSTVKNDNSFFEKFIKVGPKSINI